MKQVDVRRVALVVVAELMGLKPVLRRGLISLGVTLIALASVLLTDPGSNTAVAAPMTFNVTSPSC